MQRPALSVLLAGAPGPRVVGMPNRARNLRVVARFGATLLDDAAQTAALPPDQALLLVREDLAINVALLAGLPEAEAEPCLVGPEAGPHALFGRTGALQPLIARYLAGEALATTAGLRIHAVPETAALSLATPALARAATRSLLHQAAKATDGVVSRNFNRPVSRFFSRIFLALGLNPTHASAVSLAIGFACAWCAAQTGTLTMILAGALFQFASAFDGVDGEMARTTLSESPRGAAIDTGVDTLTYIACLLGVSIGWSREGIGPGGLWLAGSLLVFLPIVLFSLVRFVQRYTGDGSLVFVDRCVERAAKDSGSPSLRLSRVLFHAMRRDVFAALFFVISLSGVRAAVPIAVAAGALVAGLTLLLHRPRLLAAAQALAPQR